MADRADRLARQLDDAFRNRALLYWEIYQELRAELGAEAAETLLGRAIERRGVAAGTALFGSLSERTPESVTARFLSVSPDDGRLFPHAVTREGGTVRIAVSRCPLKDAWTEAGLGEGDLATMCRIAGRFDTGCFGAAGVGFSADTWTPGHAGCCTLRLAPAG